MEECRILSANLLARDKFLRDGRHTGGTLTWTRTATGEKVSSIGFEVNTLDRADAWIRLYYTLTRSGEDLDYRAGLTSAIGAVNDGHIFRFLTKPCPKDVLIRAIEAGVRQYKLLTAERELLEKTLSGSVKVLTDMLSMVNPAAFSRAGRVRRHVKHVAMKLGLRQVWQFEIAAMLSQVGCVTLPAQMLGRAYGGKKLTPHEQKMFASHPEAASSSPLAALPDRIMP